MWTPPAFTGRASNTSVTGTPIINSSDWRKIKTRRSQTTPGSPLLSHETINEHPARQPGSLSTRSACWTVLSVYVGLGLLSKPYAVYEGGWISIVFCGIFSYVANISGKMLVDCFETPQCKSSKTYADVVDKVLGFWGAVLLICVAAFEFLAATCISLLFIWANLEELMPSVNKLFLIFISTALALPTVWIVNLGEASWLSLLGCVSVLLIIFTLVFVRIYYGEQEDIDFKNFVGPNVSLSMGIFMLSLAGHAALPQVYREMSKPDDFNNMLNFCFFIMFMMYSITGILGYVIYGSMSNIIISTNMIKHPGGVLPKITAGIIIAKNYVTLNPMMAVLCNSLEIVVGIEEKRTKQRIFRTCMFLLCALLAYLAADQLPFLESIIGAFCTMMTSFIMPGILFASLKRESQSWNIWFSGRFICFFGSSMMVLLAYGAVKSLIHSDNNTD